MTTLRTQAEQIVREHGSDNCAGIRIPEEPYCSCAPRNHPFCPECEALTSAIEAALRASLLALRGEVEQLRLEEPFTKHERSVYRIARTDVLALIDAQMEGQ